MFLNRKNEKLILLQNIPRNTKQAKKEKRDAQGARRKSKQFTILHINSVDKAMIKRRNNGYRIEDIKEKRNNNQIFLKKKEELLSCDT